MDQNTNMNVSGQPEEKGAAGITIGIIIVVLVLVFGAYYFFKQVPVIDESVGASLTPKEMAADETVSALSSQGTSTEISDIQKDLNATDLSNVGTGVSNIAI